MKKILVPTDFSEVASHALEVAVGIARKTGAVIELLNVKEYPVDDVGAYYSLYGATGVSIDEAWKSVLVSAKKDMDERIKHYEGVRIRGLIEESADSFIRTVLDHDADLIVMGSTGAKGLKEFLGGSNSEEIVRLAKCPVLVVKGTDSHLGWKKVVFAVDFTYQEFIKKAIELLPIQDSEHYFVHIDNDMSPINYADTKTRMNDMAQRVGLPHATVDIFESPSIDEGILTYADEIKADLVVMYTHGRRGLSHFLLGSIAEDVVNHADISVFTFVQH